MNKIGKLLQFTEQSCDILDTAASAHTIDKVFDKKFSGSEIYVSLPLLLTLLGSDPMKDFVFIVDFLSSDSRKGSALYPPIFELLPDERAFYCCNLSVSKQQRSLPLPSTSEVLFVK